jgi:hypothetical protein
MDERDFNSFVQRQQSAPEQSPSVDWVKERVEWLAYLNKLYRQIEEFLKPYSSKKLIHIEYKEMHLDEESVGSYHTEIMVIKIGPQELTLTPKGTLLVGSKGRVDIIGALGKARLVLVDETTLVQKAKVTPEVPDTGALRSSLADVETPKSEWVWKIVSLPPDLVFVDLTQDSFFKVMMEISNG